MKKNRNTAASAALVIALSCALLAGSAGLRPALAESLAGTETAQEITVSASGSVHLVPDKASVTFGVTTQEESADLAQSKNSEAVQNVISVLTERGVEEKSIRTANYNMYPQYDYSDDGDQHIIGYLVYTTMIIQDQDVADLGKLLSDCVAAGINSIDSVNLLCSGYDEAYHQALTQAVEAARAKAGVLAAAAGKTLGDAVTITEGWQDTSARYDKGTGMTAAYALEEAMDIAPSIEPGETEISASVTVTYRMN